jgi:hypothetical protein
MPIGRGGGISFAAQEPPEPPATPPAAPAPASHAADSTAPAVETLPVTTLSDGWVLGG